MSGRLEDAEREKPEIPGTLQRFGEPPLMLRTRPRDATRKDLGTIIQESAQEGGLLVINGEALRTKAALFLLLPASVIGSGTPTNEWRHG